jgi:hypothetical protein
VKPVNAQSGRWRPLALASLVLAFLLQAWIPPGYMLAPARAGVPALVMCPGAGDHHKKKSTSAAPCPFAALAQPGVLPAPPIVAPEPPAALPPAVAGPAFLLLPPPFVAPHPPARGPPATS